MKDRYLCLVFGLTALVALGSMAHAQVAPTAALASSKAVAKNWTPPRALDGHPDLQGFWSNNNATPIERPKELNGRATVTDAELAAMKKKAHELFGGKADAAFGDNVYLAVLSNVLGLKQGFKSTDGETGDYSSVWTVERDWDNRTSLITDPPDGRIPPATPYAQKLRQAAAEARLSPAAGPEDRSLSERCITYGSPQLTEGYQSYYQIVQTPGSVMVMTEMIHDARIIQLDGSPHPSAAVQQWKGDSRGHWEGDTLVVDTTNYKPRAFMNVSSEKLHVTERFSRSAPDMLRYEMTIDDPGAWTKPWSLMIPLRQSAQPVYEYACHEGNEGLKGILAGARADEAAAAKAQVQK
jgi:hypothetical protein